jgi:mannose PTS system EIID component
MRRLPFRDHLGIFFRSLHLQGSWSFKSMQSLGFFLALAPFLARRAKDPGAALRREMAFFNTHPLMASYILGVAARLEEEGEGEKAMEARAALAGPLGAIGDGFFWATLRPLAILLGATVALLDYRAGAIVLLVAWNLPSLWTRWTLIGAGYQHPHDPVEGILERPQRAWGERLAPGIPLLVAFLLGLAGALWGSPASALLLFAAALFIFSRGWGAGQVVVTLLCALVALELLGLPVGPGFEWPFNALEDTWFPWR